MHPCTVPLGHGEPAHNVVFHSRGMFVLVCQPDDCHRKTVRLKRLPPTYRARNELSLDALHL